MPRSLVKFTPSVAIAIIEIVAMGIFSPFFWLIRALYAGRAARLQPLFESDFYLRQIRSPWRRRRAARSPLLHYQIIGWKEHRSPNRRFDPRFFVDDLNAGQVRGEPLAQMLKRADCSDIFQNEVEACAPAGALPPPRRKALVFHHARGGGSSKFLALFEANLRRQGIEPIRLRLVPFCNTLVIWPAEQGSYEVFDLEKDAYALTRKAAAASIDLIVVSHVIDLYAGIFSRLESCASMLDAKLWVILHDYFSVCARVNLVDDRGRPCSIPPVSACAACVANAGGEIGDEAPATWRQRFLDFLVKAERVIVPSEDIERRMSSFVRRPMEVWCPEPTLDFPPTRVPLLHPQETLRVIVLGSLNHAKGSQVVLDLARCQKKMDAPIEITVVGASDKPRLLKKAGVSVRGRYRDSDLKSLLSAAAPHVVLLPAIWPETWSFVLTTALELGYSVMAFAHGAQLERLQRLGRTDLVMPIDWIDRPEAILATLMTYRARHIALYSSNEVDHQPL